MFSSTIGAIIGLLEYILGLVSATLRLNAGRWHVTILSGLGSLRLVLHTERA